MRSACRVRWRSHVWEWNVIAFWNGVKGDLEEIRYAVRALGWGSAIAFLRRKGDRCLGIEARSGLERGRCDRILGRAIVFSDMVGRSRRDPLRGAGFGMR